MGPHSSLLRTQEDGDVPGSGATEVVTEERLYGIIG